MTRISRLLGAGTIAAIAVAGDGAEGRGRPGFVAFHSARDGNLEIYRMDWNGGNPMRITENGAADMDPAVSPDGQRIVFTSNRTEGSEIANNEIFVVGAGGGAPENLTRHGANDGWARWSPDGRHIVFHSNRDGNFEIYVMNADGGAPTRLTSYPGVDQYPDWSPTGRDIVFRRDVDVYAMTLDTGEVRRLTNAPPLNQMATWSPDGAHIVFMSTRDGYPSIFTMDADGANQINVTPKYIGDDASLWQSRAPSWSADGRLIYFTSFRPETQGDTEVFVMKTPGGGAKRLTYVAGVDASPRAR